MPAGPISKSVQERKFKPRRHCALASMASLPLASLDGAAATAIAVIASRAMATATPDTAGADRRLCWASVAIVTAAGGAYAGDRAIKPPSSPRGEQC